MEEIKIELLEGGIMPQKEFKESAGYDLYVPKRTSVHRGKQVVPLGFKMALPAGKAALIFSRSGVAAKGVTGFLSESKGELCNVKVMEGVITEEKYKELCESDDIYFPQEPKVINTPNGVFYAAYYRQKVFEPIRLKKCNVLLGMVDCGYRGEVGMILENNDASFYIEKGQSIAQMVIIDIPQTVLVQTDKLESSEDGRGEQGFMG